MTIGTRSGTCPAPTLVSRRLQALRVALLDTDRPVQARPGVWPGPTPARTGPTRRTVLPRMWQCGPATSPTSVPDRSDPARPGPARFFTRCCRVFPTGAQPGPAPGQVSFPSRPCARPARPCAATSVILPACFFAAIFTVRVVGRSYCIMLVIFGCRFGTGVQQNRRCTYLLCPLHTSWDHADITGRKANRRAGRQSGRHVDQGPVRAIQRRGIVASGSIVCLVFLALRCASLLNRIALCY